MVPRFLHPPASWRRSRPTTSRRKFAIRLRRMYRCASAIASKLALLSASSQFGYAAYTSAPRECKLNKFISIPLGF